ncbi:MAG: nucleoside kinase [Eubacteriales bacterium]|nr:nucleoside kinase [Eubacteriales bacterium]
MNISLDGQKKEYKVPLSLAQIIEDMAPDKMHIAMGVRDGGRIRELNYRITKDSELFLLTYKDEEGRRIYERSLRFVLLIAAKRAFPHAKVRIEHSVGEGIYIVFEDWRLYPNDVKHLEGVMRDIIKEDLPFVKRRLSKKEAIEYFSATGDEEKSRLLAYRPYEHFNVYECGGVTEYFYGAMLPSTGKVGVFSLKHFSPGFVMLLPSLENPEKPAAYLSSPKQMATFAQSNYWCRVLECSDAADLNDLIRKNKLGDFIRVNEALHDKSIADIAQDILLRGSRAVFVSGPSSSGKTTFANRLQIHLRVLGLQPIIISLDDFYRNRNELPLEEDGEPDLEALNALEVPLIRTCINSLIEGKETQMPRFDFVSQRQNKQAYTLKISANQPIIIEGIHALNPQLHKDFNPKLIFKVYISELTCLNLDAHNRIRTTDARLLRRIVRDMHFRNTPPLRTLEMWDKVRRGESKWVFPFQEEADIMFNSALHYELPVLKRFSYDIIREIPKENPQYLKVSRIIKILHYMLPAPEESLKDIPPLSILREFIGGNTLYLNHD